MICKQCTKDKPHKAFGLCDNCYAKLKRKRSPEIFRQRDKNRWSERRERQNANRRRYYQEHKEHHSAQCLEYNATHREQIRNQQAQYRAKNHEKIKERNRRYSQEHRDKVKQLARLKEFISRIPRDKRLELQRQATHKRMQRKQNLPYTLTREQWKAIKVAYNNRCAYCGCKHQKLTQDHVIPLSKGGGYTVGNIVPACISCNSRKGTGEPPKPIKILMF